ncbi:MAG: winged helix-turn-helix domain-containing protein [Anaerolineae bacterium]
MMELAVRANLWLEANGQVALSRWRVQLLEAIEASGSIRAAAAQMQITYNLAWHRLDEMEQALGVRLVERQRGGAGGGSAQLTAAGRDYVARFNRFAAAADAVIGQLFAESFGETDQGLATPA